MSYETNPILNRIKLSKGWKTSTFPTNSLNYSRDTMLWFKVYLFLKVYLLLHGFRLFASEMRLSHHYTKILYLSIAKHTFPSTKSKFKSKRKSFLHKKQNLLTKRYNKKARFLLYLNLQKLKKNSFFHFNNTGKKIFSRTWIAKPRPYSWINASSLMYNWRTNSKYKQQFRWKKKHAFYKKKNFSGVPSSKKHAINLEKNASLIAKKKLFWKKKQRSISSLLTKTQKNLFFFERYLAFLDTQIKTQTNTSITHKLANFLIYRQQQKKVFLKQIQFFYSIIKKRNLFWQQKYLNPQILSTKKYLSVQKKMYISKEKFYWIHFIKHFHLFQKNSFFATSFVKRIVFRNQKYFLNKKDNILYSSAMRTPQKKIPFIKKTALFKHVITKKKYNFLTALTLLSKTKFLKKFHKITLARLFLWKRIAQKKKNGAKKIFFKGKNKSKTFLKKQDLFYRYSYRRNYKKLLDVSTNVKLTYLIEDLIKHYFSLSVKIKICWPLSQFKNLKFYRLVFPKYKHRRQSKKTCPLKIKKNNHAVWKKYFYIGHNTQHLKFQANSFLSAVQRKKSHSSLHKISRLLLNSTSKQPYKETILNSWQKEKKKKNKYLMLKAKNIGTKSEKRLSWSSNVFFTSGLIATLTLFVKYLDPQPVVDHLAKIIGSTKKHVATLKLIETILRTFHLKRGLGYRIALIGRINGANKSRTIYLRKLNRNRSRQTFSKNVNFALAHARATIGTFAVKLWVYS